MAPGLKSLAALVAAVAMVGAAVVGRNALDTKKVRDDLRLTVVCDPLAEAFCQAAGAADPRLTIRVEPPEATTKRLKDLPQGEAPDFQAWVTVGPWLQMADGRRTGQPALQEDVAYVASSGLVLITRPDQKLPLCPDKPAPAACLPLPSRRVGLASPKTSGVGLAGLAQVVMADTALAATDLDRRVIEDGPAAAVVARLSRAVNPGAGLEQLNVGFALANPLVTIEAVVPPAGRAQVVKSQPDVQAVLQVGILDGRAKEALGGEPAGRALVKAATDAGWGPVGEPSGGLPEPGVLAALQDAWTGP